MDKKITKCLNCDNKDNILDVISKDLNRFNKFKCDSRFFDIRFDGEIINTCTRKKINSIISFD